MLQRTDLAGSFILPGTAVTVNGMGYGAIQLAGREVWGSPRDVNAAIASAGFRWARKSPLAGNATNLTDCVRIR